jgi:hypothetical protein
MGFSSLMPRAGDGISMLASRGMRRTRMSGGDTGLTHKMASPVNSQDTQRARLYLPAEEMSAVRSVTVTLPVRNLRVSTAFFAELGFTSSQGISAPIPPAW